MITLHYCEIPDDDNVILITSSVSSCHGGMGGPGSSANNKSSVELCSFCRCLQCHALVQVQTQTDSTNIDHSGAVAVRLTQSSLSSHDP